MKTAVLAGPTGPVISLPELAAADDNFAGVLSLADSLLASRTAAARALARALYAALFRLHDDAAQRERLLRDLVWRAASWPGAAAGAIARTVAPLICCACRALKDVTVCPGYITIVMRISSMSIFAWRPVPC